MFMRKLTSLPLTTLLLPLHLDLARKPLAAIAGLKPLLRELESPATSHVKPGTESRFSEPCESDNKDIGNPDERIPDPLPENHGDEDAIAITGNPDIRVPGVIERDNGLHVRRTLRTEDAEEEYAEKGGRRQNPSRRLQEEEQKHPSPGDTTTGKEGPEECELRHVPGGMWLNQGDS
ncbi:hypothetical protein NDU88_003241 [Pleurodeles waltl]|uniref:Uncharacterized protein n=1 Tax=Pleurodeles waltl TaxID=8319 RepID=A0AAV7T4H6_PLEWA|nr:hypothetical protein NDU88_003241 [Pleurodeles waltl]